MLDFMEQANNHLHLIIFYGELMTDTNLPTTIDAAELAAFIERNHVSQEDLNGSGDFLPQLRANYQDEIEYDGKKYTDVKLGVLVVNTPEYGPVFAKNVKFRPLLQNYQYIDYDKVAEKVVNRSILFNDFSDEARDEKGTIRCGKPPSKELKDNAPLKKQWDHVQLYRSVDGLVSFKGNTLDGTEVEINNLLVTYRGKCSNFTPFQEEYTKQMPKGSLLWDYELTLSTTRHKSDPKSIVYYYVVHFEADFSNKLPFTAQLFDTVKGLQARVDSTNKDINNKYYTALEANSTSSAAEKAIDITPNVSLDEELNGVDELPF